MGRLGWLATLLSFGLGCIPSHRMLHQANSYFEHCYAADSDTRVTDAQREGCWNAWLAHYTRHQPGERVDYAMRRVESLQMGGSFEAPADPNRAPVEDPLTSLHTLQALATAEPDGHAPNGCATACQQLRAACQGACMDDADPCIKSCEANEHTCLGGCF